MAYYRIKLLQNFGILVAQAPRKADEKTRKKSEDEQQPVKPNPVLREEREETFFYFGGNRLLIHV